MTLPALPAQGSTSWYTWASGIHSAVSSSGSGGNYTQVAAATGVAATDTGAIQSAIDAASGAGGGTVLLGRGTYATNATITIPHKIQLLGLGSSATAISYSGTGIAVQHSPATEAYDTRAGIRDLQIIGTSGAGATGLEVSDTFGFGIERVVVRDFTAGCGVRLHNKLRWTEGTYVEDLHIRNCATGLAFKRTAASGAHDSFGWTCLYRVAINVPPSGIGVNFGETTDTILLYNSIINTVCWIQDNATAYRVGTNSVIDRCWARLLGEEEGAGATGTVGVNNLGKVTVYGEWAEGLGDSNTFGYFKVLPNYKSSDYSQGADASGHTYRQIATITPGVQHDAAFGYYEASGISSPYVAMYEGGGNALKVLRVNFGTKVTDATTALLLLVTKDGHVYAMGAIATGKSTTAGRPSAATVGQGAMYYDTTLGIPIWSNGTVWKNASGTTV